MISQSQFGNVLAYGAIPILAIYFYLFQRAVGSLPATEQARFVSDASLPTWRRVIGMAPFPLILLASSSSLRMVLACWLTIQFVVDSRAHEQKLEILLFDTGFRRRLHSATVLAGVAISMVAFGMVLLGV